MEWWGTRGTLSLRTARSLSQNLQWAGWHWGKKGHRLFPMVSMGFSYGRYCCISWSCCPGVQPMSICWVGREGMRRLRAFLWSSNILTQTPGCHRHDPRVQLKKRLSVTCSNTWPVPLPLQQHQSLQKKCNPTDQPNLSQNLPRDLKQQWEGTSFFY